ncbi:MAG: hypothetical protein ABFD83_14800 [Armatimonadota bacterium]
MRAATAKATAAIYQESRKNLKEMIYDKPIPNRMETQIERKRKADSDGRRFSARKNFLNSRTMSETREGKKPAWHRSGNLRRSERMRIASAYLGVIFNDSGYAAARHDMKCRYPAPWRTRAIQTMGSQARQFYREGIVRAMRAGIIPGA